jgi:hypothetical protein
METGARLIGRAARPKEVKHRRYELAGWEFKPDKGEYAKSEGPGRPSDRDDLDRRQAERLKALGASEVINYTETPDWSARLHPRWQGPPAPLTRSFANPTNAGEDLVPNPLGSRIIAAPLRIAHAHCRTRHPI